MTRTRCFMFLLLSAPVAGGCDSGPGDPRDPPASRPGTRLSAVVAEVDGVRAPPSRWYDKLLNVECDFTQVGDAYRCLPDSAWIVYADSACTEPLLEVRQGVPEGTPVLGLGDETFGHCGLPSTPRAFIAGKELTPRTVYGPFDCEPGESVRVLREVAEELPMARFVSAKSVRVPIEGRFDGKVLHADDGTRDFYAIYDKKLGTNVSSFYSVLQPTYTADLLNGYSDEACNESIGLVGSGCSAGYAMGNVELDGCKMTADLWKLGKKRADEGYGLWSDGCQTTYYPAWEASKQVPWSELALADRRIEGSGRIRTVWARAQGGEKDLYWAAFYDSQLGLECYPTRITDTLTRCAPSHAWSFEFLDAQCKIPIVWHAGCTEVMSTFTGTQQGYFRITDRTTLLHHYKVVEGECERVEQEEWREALVGRTRIPYHAMAAYRRLVLDADAF